MAIASKRRAERRKNLSTCQRTGIPEGFIKFNTVAERILKVLHRCGPLSLHTIREEMPEDSINAVSTTMTRLRKYKFIKEVGRDRLPGARSHGVFGLYHKRYAVIPRLPNLTKAERTRQYRARLKALKINSVFNFTGTISL